MTAKSVLDEKSLGQRLQQARLDGGLTQQELCQQADLSYSTLTKIERGAIKAPSIFTIQSIAEALHVSLDQLMGMSMPGSTTRRQTSKSGVRFVYFDLNGCLVRGASKAFTALAHDSGQPIDVVESNFWRYDAQVCRGDMSVEEFERLWSERLGITTDWQQQYVAAIEVMPGMPELVSWVADQYYTGILSNTRPGLIEGLRSADKLSGGRFDTIIDSSVIHSLKPEPPIYEAAASQAGVAASEILLIDDTRGNLAAAEQLGWHVIHFDSYDPAGSIENIRTALQPA